MRQHQKHRTAEYQKCKAERNDTRGRLFSYKCKHYSFPFLRYGIIISHIKTLFKGQAKILQIKTAHGQNREPNFYFHKSSSVITISSFIICLPSPSPVMESPHAHVKKYVSLKPSFSIRFISSSSSRQE